MEEIKEEKGSQRMPVVAKQRGSRDVARANQRSIGREERMTNQLREKKYTREFGVATSRLFPAILRFAPSLNLTKSTKSADLIDLWRSQI